MEIQKDIGEEIIKNLKHFNQWVINIQKENTKKDKKIKELESKIKEYKMERKE